MEVVMTAFTEECATELPGLRVVRWGGLVLAKRTESEPIDLLWGSDRTEWARKSKKSVKPAMSVPPQPPFRSER